MRGFRENIHLQGFAAVYKKKKKGGVRVGGGEGGGVGVGGIWLLH